MVEVFSIYLEALANYPDIVIKDRLDGMNLLWDVTQPDESFNTDYSDHAFIEPDVGLVMPGVEEGEAYRNPSLIARAYRWAAAFHFPGESLTGQLHNMLLWRSGAWLILLCVIMLYWIRRRLSDLWLCAAPLLLRERGSAIRDTLDSTLFLANQTARPLWESVNSTALIQAAQAGLGITVLPDLLLAEPVAQKRLRVVALDGVDMRNEMLAVRNRNQRPSRGLRVLLDAVGGITA